MMPFEVDRPPLPARGLLRQALEHCGGNVAATARLLGMKRSTLYDRLRRCGLRTPPRPG